MLCLVGDGHRIIDLSVDGVQIVEMARKACISYEDVEKMAEHFSLEISPRK